MATTMTSAIRLYHPETKKFRALQPRTNQLFSGTYREWHYAGTLKSALTPETWLAEKKASGWVEFKGWSGSSYLPKPEEKKFTSAEFAKLWKEAQAKGHEAATAIVPVPMHVVQRANPFDDNSPIVRRFEPVADGVCGFAWVTFPGNTAFGRWAKKNQPKVSAHYPKGLSLWIGDYDQSMTRKEAYARAFAAHIRAAGIPNVYGESRMD